MKLKNLCALVLALASAGAQAITGNQALDTMQSMAAGERSGVLIGVVSGFVEGVTIAEIVTGNRLQCQPSSVTNVQLYDMARATLVRDPSIRHEQFTVILYTMVDATWPCPARQQKQGQSL